MPRPSISVIIPTLNEQDNLPHVLPRIPTAVDEVILVDGRSSDRTVEVARELMPDIRIVVQDGMGKGAALRSGFAAARGDIIVMLDADGSTAPEEIPLFVHALLAGADFAKGSRFLHGGGTTDMPFHRRLGNATFVRMVRRIYGGQYTDLCYGYNAFWRRVLPLLDLDGDGFEIETMMNIRALRAGLRIVEVPSFEDRRVYGIGRLRTIPDGWRVLRTIWSERRHLVMPASAQVGAPWEPVLIEAAGASFVVGRELHGLTNANANGNGHANANGNGHANGNGQTNGNGHADFDPSTFVELTVAQEEPSDTYRAFPVGAPGLVERTTTWTTTADTYIERLSVLIDRIDRAAVGQIVEELRRARDQGATIFLAGNGGSSATAAHWVNDLGKATKQSGQAPFRVMNLSDNVPWLTALGNDEGIDRVFAGQLENFARPGDVVIVISASGNSPNILRLLEAADAVGMTKIGLLGFDGGSALAMLDEALWVETEPGAYGLVETAHSALADIVTTCLINDRASVLEPAL
jgi:phosphoheptose isomerase